MNRAPARFIAAALTVLMVACSHQDDSIQPRLPTETPAHRPLGNDAILSRLSILPGQTLTDGECGLFLWLKREDAPLVLFQRSGQAHAMMNIDGRPQKLMQSIASGQTALTFYTHQQFEADDLKATLKVTMQRDQSLRQGLKVPSGTIAVQDGAGWSAVLSVAGAVACK